MTTDDEPQGTLDEQKGWGWEKPVEQPGLFDDLEDDWRPEWQGMPEYTHEDLAPYKTLLVHFASREDMAAFQTLVGQNVYEKTQSIWYPEAVIGRTADRRYVDG